MADYQYIGSELELFSAAMNWKEYWSSKIKPYLKGSIVEVGAGIGANTLLLSSGAEGKWICLEPDLELLNELKQRTNALSHRSNLELFCGTLDALPAGQRYDSILYIDVMEHIEDDSGEANRAASRLSPGGHLIVLSPAHQYLFSPFDAAIGHCRRYNKSTLRRIQPKGLQEVAMFYLDSAGMLLSAANRILLQQSMPTRQQLSVWDRYIVPLSRRLDPLFGNRIGKTIVGVWRKEENAQQTFEPGP